MIRQDRYNKEGCNEWTKCCIMVFFFKSIDGVLGIRTRGSRMEDTDESTELRRHPNVTDERLYDRYLLLLAGERPMCICDAIMAH